VAVPILGQHDGKGLIHLPPVLQKKLDQLKKLKNLKAFKDLRMPPLKDMHIGLPGDLRPVKLPPGSPEVPPFFQGLSTN